MLLFLLLLVVGRMAALLFLLLTTAGAFLSFALIRRVQRSSDDVFIDVDIGFGRYDQFAMRHIAKILLDQFVIDELLFAPGAISKFHIRGNDPGKLIALRTFFHRERLLDHHVYIPAVVLIGNPLLRITNIS